VILSSLLLFPPIHPSPWIVVADVLDLLIVNPTSLLFRVHACVQRTKECCIGEQSGVECCSNRVLSSGSVNLKAYVRMIGITTSDSAVGRVQRWQVFNHVTATGPLARVFMCRPCGITSSCYHDYFHSVNEYMTKCLDELRNTVEHGIPCIQNIQNIELFIFN